MRRRHARIALPYATLAMLALGGTAASCNLVLGLDNYIDCPEDPKCPKGSGGATTTGHTGGSTPAPTCTDEKKNGTETDVDCGGSECPKCADDKGCENGGDCTSKVCSGGLCIAPSCGDMVQNGDETDKDCGGPTCPKCALDAACVVHGDCIGGSCVGGKCAATCTDGVTDGSETDVDCGGPSCPKCKEMEDCTTGPDCETGVCQSQKCVSYYVWAKKYGNTSLFRGLAVDSVGDIFINGSTGGPLDFGGGPLSPTSGGNAAFTAKLGPSSNELWSVLQGNSGSASDSSHAAALALDAVDGVITGGHFNGTVKFGATTLTNANMFLATLDQQGGYAHWALKANASQLNHWVTGVAASPDGSTLAAGQFSGTLTWNGGSLGIPASGQRDLFLFKTDATGTLSVNRHFGVSGQHGPLLVASDASSNIVLAGSIRGVLDFGGGQITSITPGLNSFNVVIAKLDPAGQHLWSRRVGDGPNQLTGGLAVDGSGNIIVAGSFSGSGDFGAGMLTSTGSTDVFVAKYDPFGTLLWAKLFGDASDQGSTVLAVDAAGNIAIAGVFDGEIDFGGGALMSSGSGDIFVAKLDPSGNHVWSRSFGDAQPQSVTAIAFSGSQNLVLTGTFQSQIDFGGGQLTATGGAEAFVAKFLVP